MPLKVDLGRVFPGVIILIVGIVLLVIWIIVVIISIFVAVNLYVSMVLLTVALGCIIAGIIQIFRGMRGLRGMVSRRQR